MGKRARLTGAESAEADTKAAFICSNDGDGGLLSPALMEQLGVQDAADVVIGRKKRKVKNSEATATDAPAKEEEKDLAQRLSKAKQKKMDQIAARKIKDVCRGSLYERLQASQLSAGQQALLTSSKELGRGRGATAKARLARCVQRARAGLPITAAELADVEEHAKLLAHVEDDLALSIGEAMLAVKAAAAAAGLLLGKESVAGATTAAVEVKEIKVRPRVRESARPEPEKGPNATTVRGKGEAASSNHGNDDHGMAAAALCAADEGKRLPVQQPRQDPALASAADVGGPSCSNYSGNGDGGGGESGAVDWAAKLMEGVSSLKAATEQRRQRQQQQLLQLPGGAGASSPAVEIPAPSQPLPQGETAPAGAGGAAIAYPPPPRWLTGPVPAYVPVETPLALPSQQQGGCPALEALASSSPVAADGCFLPQPARISVKRPAGLQEARMALPACGMEQEIVELVGASDVVILCGETGSGKSTQVPQFLYEAGYAATGGMIGITQPRRVAAVSTARRVAEELGTTCGHGGAVAYQIRFDSGGIGPSTHVKFMTDGILLREATEDLLLRRYSVLLLDEAHERSLNTDVLLGLLSRAVPLRRQAADADAARWLGLPEAARRNASTPRPLPPLKLVVMSATLRVEDFTANAALFASPPPVLRINSRQHPVTVHFSRRTELEDYEREVYRKVCRIHRSLPEGGILVFVTGRQEILRMCARLRRAFGSSSGIEGIGSGGRQRQQQNRDGAVEEAGDRVFRGLDQEEAEADALEYDDFAANGASDEDGGGSESELDGSRSGSRERDGVRAKEKKEGEEDDTRASLGNRESPSVAMASAHAAGAASSAAVSVEPLRAMHVLPLFAALTAEEQARVFSPPPKSHRLVVVATNVAETSLTIPGISYVVDCGRVKQRVTRHHTGVSGFEVGWISRASADQRAGRAGRTGPGHCYRLYSSAVYTNTFQAFAAPEVTTRPLEDVVLQMKAMGLRDVAAFPFPTPPAAAAMAAAETLLVNLGAVEASGAGPGTAGAAKSNGGGITTAGRAYVMLPLGVRFAKMLLLARQGGVLGLGIAMVSMLTEQEPFLDADHTVEEATAGSGSRDHTRDSKGPAADARRNRVDHRWRHEDSDALTRLQAAGAYAFAVDAAAAAAAAAIQGRVGGQRRRAVKAAAAGAARDFCRKNQLHAPTMERALQLRRQLTRLANLRFGSQDGHQACAVAQEAGPPTSEAAVILKRVLLSGLLDNVARLAPVEPVPEGGGTEEARARRRRRGAYLGCSGASDEFLFIPRSSAVYRSDPKQLPEFVCYLELVRDEGGVARMQCVTAVEPAWLADLALGTPLLRLPPPLPAPPPAYDRHLDCMTCHVVPLFGARGWELPMHRLGLAEHGGDDLARRWFARRLLEGLVEKRLVKVMAAGGGLNDTTALLTGGRPAKKAVLLLRELAALGPVSTRRGLRMRWRKEPSFLLSAAQLWIAPDRRADFAAAWKAAASAAAASSIKRNKGL